MVKSKINPILTLDYMVHEPENKYFDRKSAKIKPSDLAPLISAFANAEGGTIVIGINDKTLEIEGVSTAGEDRLNDFINAAKDYCKPMPKNEYEYLMDACILKLVDLAKKYIVTQLREFTALDTQTGTFKIVPEYPEFAWLEGIVNAIVHREYVLAGDYILVAMYDDRLEIKSPGKLPNMVTVENIKHTRYARNPKISRVLTEFGYVREI